MSREQRLQMQGHLVTLEKDRDRLIAEAENQLTLILAKADPYTDINTLDTDKIYVAAKHLHDSVTRLKQVLAKINELNAALYG